MPDYECQVCGQEFDTAAQVNGHVGGKHARKHERLPINHGTIGGYMAHRRRDEESCVDCKVAWTRYYARYREKKGRAE